VRNCRDGGPNICSERAARHLSRGARDTSARRAVGNGFTFLPPWCLILTPGAVTRGSRRSGPVPVPYAARMESQDAELSGSVITFDDTVEEGAAAQPTPRSALSESAKNDFPTKESSAQDLTTVSCAGTGCGAQDVVTRSCAAQGVAQDMARVAQDMVTESCVFGIISCAAHRMW